MTLSYQVYGLRLRANRPIPGLIPAPEDAPADVYVEWGGARPSQTLPTSQPIWPPVLAGRNPEAEVVRLWKSEEADGLYFQLHYESSWWYVDFLIKGDGSSVRVTWSDSAVPRDVALMLLGTPMGCVLRLRGVICLHASALACGDVAAAILGPKGAGKSTTVAALAKFGHTVFADDVVALIDNGQEFLVPPGQPGLKLWPDAAAALYGPAERLPNLWTKADGGPDKLYLELAGEGRAPQPGPLPLAAIYVLAERDPATTAPDVSPIPPAERLMALMTNTYADHILDRDMRARDFRSLSRVTATVPLRRVRRPDTLAALPQICDAILADLHAVTNSLRRDV
jgi:hypothetical protein